MTIQAVILGSFGREVAPNARYFGFESLDPKFSHNCDLEATEIKKNKCIARFYFPDCYSFSSSSCCRQIPLSSCNLIQSKLIQIMIASSIFFSGWEEERKWNRDWKRKRM